MIFHRHKWIVVSKQEQPAPLDIMAEAGMTNVKSHNLYSLIIRPVIVHYRCETCKKEKVVRV